ncbi:hypothetical protein tinsulaeT_19170 [Thalassotalea insulae]|uniref:HmuY protein n=1 Tax=Thalassotalea insulae TaxID=2056778 RepID=A0ABQ6GTA3_9GAMM|nr:HmuY family protein [Thalassotalea insulae]GLX78577.1 hypothetical protein tinsulaeT_19170 [Thalassotalea insulae]
MKFNSALSITSLALNLTLCAILSACGGGSSSKDTTDPEPQPTPEPTAPVQGQIFGPYSTGSVNEPAFVYFDLDSHSVVALTAEQATTNTEWDIAFKRSGIYLNQHQENTITAYSTGNNSDFFDAEGKPIADSFINATADTELDDYLAVTTSNVPTEEGAFVGDITSNIVDGFYNYNSSTHVVTAAEDHYFIVHSDDAFTKFNVTNITTEGRAMSEISIALGYQGVSDVEFGIAQTLTIDAALACSGDTDSIYIDFDTQQEVTVNDDWDINLPCIENNADNNSGADFIINLADDAKALQDFDNNYTSVDASAVAYYGFKDNSYSVKAFDATPWYQYNLSGGHLLWSQFDVYLINTPTSTYKLQMTSYYNEDGVSGHISFRADQLTELAGTSQ